MTGLLAALDRAFNLLIRAHQWTPVESIVALLVGSVLLSLCAAWLVDWLFDGLAALRRWRCRREVRRVIQGGLSGYADPARMYRETAHHVHRLAARQAAADAGTDRRVGAPGVDPAAGVSDDPAREARARDAHGHHGRGDLGTRVPAVSGQAQGLVRDGRAGGYGAGTTLVFPVAPAPKRLKKGAV